MRDRTIYRLCAITDRGLARGRNLTDVVMAAVQGGATMVQLREKEAPTREFLEQARVLKALLAPCRSPAVVNDRVDIALAVDADGVHVGQSDMPAEVVRALVGPGKILGLSVTNEQQISVPMSRLPTISASDRSMRRRPRGMRANRSASRVLLRFGARRPSPSWRSAGSKPRTPGH